MLKLLTALTMIVFSWAVMASDLPLIGLDKDNKPVQVMIDSTTYQDRLGKALNGVQQATLPVLAQQKSNGTWAFNTFLIGIGVNFDIGIAGLLRVGAVPRFRLLFSDVANPAIP